MTFCCHSDQGKYRAWPKSSQYKIFCSFLNRSQFQGEILPSYSAILCADKILINIPLDISLQLFDCDFSVFILRNMPKQSLRKITSFKRK